MGVNMGNMYNPGKMIENFKCSLCKKHVFVPPITTDISRTSYKCGRCNCIESDHTTRLTEFEKLASYLIFPCSYEGCDAIIPWNEVRNHESSCNYRIINCPSDNCPDSFPVDNMIAHFRVKHNDCISTNSKEFRIESCATKHRMIIYEEEPYLMCYFENENCICIRVYSIIDQPKDLFFQIHLSNLNKKQSFTFKGDIIPFNDQEPCVNLSRSHSITHTKNIEFYMEKSLIPKLGDFGVLYSTDRKL